MSSSECGAAVSAAADASAEPLAQHGGDVLVGGDHDPDRAAKHDFGGAQRGGVGRVRHRELAAVRGHERENC